MRPVDLPPAEAYPHGTRARYVARCRCDECRGANREYARARALAKARGETNELVPAAPVRAHLLKLSRAGVGYKSAAEASGVSRSVVAGVYFGGATQLRRQLAQRLLAVDASAVADGACVDARPTMALVRKLVSLGVTRARIATVALGLETPALQIGRGGRVLASTALAIEKFARRELPVLKLMRQPCPLCRHAHDGDRQAAEYCAAEMARGVVAHEVPVGTTANQRISAERVLSLVPTDDTISPEEVAQALGVDRVRIDQALARLARSGRVRRVAVGAYSKTEAA
jgi:hypothetical protein